MINATINHTKTSMPTFEAYITGYFNRWERPAPARSPTFSTDGNGEATDIKLPFIIDHHARNGVTYMYDVCVLATELRKFKPSTWAKGRWNAKMTDQEYYAKTPEQWYAWANSEYKDFPLTKPIKDLIKDTKRRHNAVSFPFMRMDIVRQLLKLHDRITIGQLIERGELDSCNSTTPLTRYINSTRINPQQTSSVFKNADNAMQQFLATSNYY